MMFRFIGTLSLIWLAMTMSSVAAQNAAVLDTDENPVQSGVEYYVLPAATDVAGGLTLVSRNDPCPLFVAQEPLTEVVSQGFLVTFKLLADNETVIRESNSFTATFSAVSTCVQPNTWNVGERETETNRRLIVAGSEQQYASYFKILNDDGLYYFEWCPSDVCPTCRFDCGSVGLLDENGKTLLALDGSRFFFRFKKV